MPFTEHELELELGLQHYAGVDGYLIACSYHGTWRVDLARGAVSAPGPPCERYTISACERRLASDACERHGSGPC